MTVVKSTPAVSIQRGVRLAENWDWRRHAACREADPALFFHPDGERGTARKHRQALARSVCAGCSVAEQCRTHSVVFQESFGTWGGLTEEDRSQLLSGRAINIRTHHGSRIEDRGNDNPTC